MYVLYSTYSENILPGRKSSCFENYTTDFVLIYRSTISTPAVFDMNLDLSWISLVLIPDLFISFFMNTYIYRKIILGFFFFKPEISIKFPRSKAAPNKVSLLTK